MGNFFVLAYAVPQVPALVGIVVVVVIIGLHCFKRYLSTNNCLDMPGPLSFPFIGCIMLFCWSSSPHKTLAWLSKVYGNVYSLNLGGTNVVIVNSMDTIKQVLYRSNQDFAGRPQLFSYGLWGCKDSFMCTDYNSDYLRHKYKAQISLQELFNSEECTCSRFRKAVQTLNGKFHEIQESKKSAFNPDKYIRVAVADLVMDCLFGPCISRLFYHEARVVLEQAATAYVQTAYVGACTDFISVMRFLSRKTINSARLYVAELHEFVRKVYQVHKGSFLQQSDNTASLAYVLRSDPKRYCYHLDQCLQDSQDTALNDNRIVELLTEIMFNAYEKISTCFAWCVARLAADHGLQREIQKELTDDFIKDCTPLLTATINEVLRTSCVLPLGIPRRTIRDTTLHGYNIPQGTLVFLNFWSCCNDVQKFSNPHEFNPYRRYISSSSEEVENAEIFPSFCCFSGGERKCLGDSFARRCLIALAGGMLREYELELVTPNISQLQGKYGFTFRPCNYTIFARSRDAQTLSL